MSAALNATVEDGCGGTYCLVAEGVGLYAPGDEHR